MFRPYKPSFGGCYWYLVKGSSTVCYKDTATGEVIASKDHDVIQRIADTLNRGVNRT